jgi:NifB/MoaA-like Fe-S oxidoreductase
VVTEAASYPTISRLAEKLEEFFPKLTVRVYKIINNFYGESITVSGLLTGKDIAEQLCGKPLGEELLIPENALRSERDLFLCGMSVDELSEKLSVKVGISENDGYEFVRSILGAD